MGMNLTDIAKRLREQSEALGEDTLDSAPADVRMQRAPVPVKGYDKDTPVRIYPNDDVRSLLSPREEGYPEDYGLDLRDAPKKPTTVARRPKPAAADDEPLPELLANFTKGMGGVADRAQAAMEAGPDRAPGVKGFMAKAVPSAAMGAGTKPPVSEVAQLSAELRKPREVPPELQELLQGQQRRGQASDLAGVSDALYSTFSRTPLKPMQQRDPVQDLAERGAMTKHLDAKQLEDPNSEQSRNARAMFASTETGKAFQKEMGPLFERLPASKIPGAEFLIKASARKQGTAPAEMDPAKRALMEAQTRNLDARTDELGRPKPARAPRPAAAPHPSAADAKKQQSLMEVQDRYNNIKRQIGELKQLITDDGTYDVTGAHNGILNQKISDIATDMAKLVDPTSVARESEVEGFKKKLFSPTPFMQDDTAQDLLGSFEKDLESRLDSAYQVRGLDRRGAQTSAAPAAASGPTPTGRTKTGPDGITYEEMSDGSARKQVQ